MKIAFMGISGSGKDYFAEFLVNQLYYKRFSFSDQLKKIAVKIFPWLDRDYPPIKKEIQLNIELSTGETIIKSPREIWLKLNCLREIESKIFIRMLEEEIFKTFVILSQEIEEDIIISDIRTLDEYQWCKDNNYTIIHINPLKRIYRSNDFDNNIFNSKMVPDYTFNNDFNGIEKFKKFFYNEVK